MDRSILEQRNDVIKCRYMGKCSSMVHGNGITDMFNLTLSDAHCFGFKSWSAIRFIFPCWLEVSPRRTMKNLAQGLFRIPTAPPAFCVLQFALTFVKFLLLIFLYDQKSYLHSTQYIQSFVPCPGVENEFWNGSRERFSNQVSVEVLRWFTNHWK